MLCDMQALGLLGMVRIVCIILRHRAISVSNVGIKMTSGTINMDLVR
jgi:hypothetical protein